MRVIVRMKSGSPAQRGASIDIQRQRGSALVTGLVFLVVIMMLGLSASSSSIQQEMGMRNNRDQAVALEAADAALRAGETWLRTNEGPLPLDYGPQYGNAMVYPQGFCLPVPAVPPLPAKKSCVEAGAKFWNDNGQPLGGAGTDPTPLLKVVAEQPRYIIELFYICPTCESSEVPPRGRTRYYQITARGIGISSQTDRIVQSVYRY